MNSGRFLKYMLCLGLFYTLSAAADIDVDTESLRLRFSDDGDLLRAVACLPVCADPDAKSLELSSGQGLLIFGQSNARQLEPARKHDGVKTTLTFADASGRVLRRWQVPDAGWLISMTSPATETLTLASGRQFRPQPSSGFGNLLEQTRYLVFAGSSVETVGLHEAAPVSLQSDGWFGFRNRFWTAMVLPKTPLAITLSTGDGIEDARIGVTGAGQDHEFELDIYLGPIEPSALSGADAGLESLMYSGLWFWLRWICQLLYHLLNWINIVVPQWGLAVMVLSVLVGVIMRPLSKIAERLQDQVHEIDARVAPRLAVIKKSHKGAEQSEKVIEMYKEEGVHPLYSMKSLVGVLVVIPVFIGAFDMLAENIHLSGEAFLWISDLSHPDEFLKLPFDVPFFGSYLNLLPFVMTGFSFIASRLHSHPAMDTTTRRRQSRNLVLMSLGFLILFYTFPAGMVLYWTTNNLISVIKSLWKRRMLDAG